MPLPMPRYDINDTLIIARQSDHVEYPELARFAGRQVVVVDILPQSPEVGSWYAVSGLTIAGRSHYWVHESNLAIA